MAAGTRPAGHSSSRAITASFASISREDLTMDQLAMPIVAVDADLRPIALEHNRAHAPQFEVRVITGAGHWLMLDKPMEFASTLRGVVEAIESGKAKRRPS